MPPLHLVSSSRESEIRHAAIEWLNMRSNGGDEPLTRDTLADDFYFDSEKFRLIPAQQGI